MKYNLSEIMKRANEIKEIEKVSLKEALEYSWNEFKSETITMAIIEDDVYEHEYLYVPESEITNATLGDMREYGFSETDLGLKFVGENEYGEELYTSDFNFEGEKTWEEIEEIETDWFVIKYWDGNNHQMQLFENYTSEEVVVVRRYDREGNPLYSYSYDLIMEDGSRIETSQSNCSGSLSPFFNVVENMDY